MKPVKITVEVKKEYVFTEFKKNAITTEDKNVPTISCNMCNKPMPKLIKMSSARVKGAGTFEFLFCPECSDVIEKKIEASKLKK